MQNNNFGTEKIRRTPLDLECNIENCAIFIWRLCQMAIFNFDYIVSPKMQMEFVLDLSSKADCMCSVHQNLCELEFANDKRQTCCLVVFALKLCRKCLNWRDFKHQNMTWENWTLGIVSLRCVWLGNFGITSDSTRRWKRWLLSILLCVWLD